MKNEWGPKKVLEVQVAERITELEKILKESNIPYLFDISYHEIPDENGAQQVQLVGNLVISQRKSFLDFYQEWQSLDDQEEIDRRFGMLFGFPKSSIEEFLPTRILQGADHQRYISEHFLNEEDIFRLNLDPELIRFIDSASAFYVSKNHIKEAVETFSEWMNSIKTTFPTQYERIFADMSLSKVEEYKRRSRKT